MKTLDEELLSQISALDAIEPTTINIRKNGESSLKKIDEDIQIVPKKDKNGIDIIVKPNVKNKSCHIPVILTKIDMQDLVFNDFYIGENSDITIVAGCGINCAGKGKSEHIGIHSFYLGKNSKIRYIEKHIGMGDNLSQKVINPYTKIFMKKDSEFLMESYQIGGVTYADRKTEATLYENAKLIIKEKILTQNTEIAKTNFKVNLKGKNSSVDVSSRSVAKDNSYQNFYSSLKGENMCFGHVECDAIMNGNAKIVSTPKIIANNQDATLVHEASIGKIAGEQIIKLMSLGLNQEEAENVIIKGFLI